MHAGDEVVAGQLRRRRSEPAGAGDVAVPTDGLRAREATGSCVLDPERRSQVARFERHGCER